MAIGFPVIILVLIAIILGIAVGYSMAQKRLQQEADVLQNKNQQRLQAIETAHEQRLSDALFKARQDYEAQLAYRIGQYQDQFSQSLAEREQEHETRLEVWQQGVANGVQTSGQPATAPEVMQLKHQYESRLKEAAHKLQHAYEQKLAQQSQAATRDLQQAYETKLSQKIAHYETQLAERITQLESEFEARKAVLTPASTPEELAPETEEALDSLDNPLDELPAFPQASPSEIMGTSNNEPTITLHRPFSLSNSDTAPAPEANLPDLDVVDVAPAAPQPLRADEEAPASDLAEPQDQILADLAELDEIPPLPDTNPPDPLDDLANLSQKSQDGELDIEIEQLDSLDLDDIDQLS